MSESPEDLLKARQTLRLHGMDLAYKHERERLRLAGKQRLEEVALFARQQELAVKFAEAGQSMKPFRYPSASGANDVPATQATGTP